MYQSICIDCGVVVESWNRNRKFCSNRCQQDHQQAIQVKAWLDAGNWKVFAANKQPPPFIKRHLCNQANDTCQLCGISEWLGKPITLELDHIDGDWANNNIANLRVICPNCHSQTSTYKNRNKGNGRSKM